MKEDSKHSHGSAERERESERERERDIDRETRREEDRSRSKWRGRDLGQVVPPEADGLLLLSVSLTVSITWAQSQHNSDIRSTLGAHYMPVLRAQCPKW